MGLPLKSQKELPGEGRRGVKGAEQFVCGYLKLIRSQAATLRAVIMAQSKHSTQKEGKEGWLFY
jgi:hypothetical protein